MSESSVCIVTFGCQMNKADFARMEGILSSEGFRLVNEPDEADVVLVNTCSVREGAEGRAVNMLRSAGYSKDARPAKVIGICGCVAERRGEELLEAIPGLSFVVGPRQIGRIGDLVRSALEKRGPSVCTGASGVPEPSIARPDVGITEMVKAVEGCSNYCAYCIVPHLRGPEKSRRVEEIVTEVEDLVARGTREVVLLGQNIMAYGTDWDREPGYALIELLGGLDSLEDLWRVRLVTAHPRDVQPWFIRSLTDYRQFCPQFQIPFQAGSNEVLSRMGRGYTREEFMEKVDLLREVFQDPGLFVDIIAGFPGETSSQFDETLDLLERVAPDRAYIFKYSVRPGTRAAPWPDDVPPEEKQRRLVAADSLQKGLSLQRNQSLVGSSVEILVEGPSKRDSSRLTGRTPEGRIGVFPGDGSFSGQRVKMIVEDATPVCLYGDMLESLQADA